MRISDWSSDVCSSDLLALEITEIGPVLDIARERREICRELLRHLGGISEPLILVGLQPAKTVADDNAAPNRAAPVFTRAVKGRAEKDDRIARLRLRDDRRLGRLFDERLKPVAPRPDQCRPVRFGELGQDRKSTRLNSSH